MSDAVPYANYQYEIYLRGMAGQRPARSFDWRQLEQDALNLLRRGPRGYIAGGAGLGETMRANREAFDHWRLRPRMLRDVSERSLERTVLGTELPAPVLLAPVGVQTLAHPEGELAMARGAAQVGVPFVASTAASHTIEQIAEEAGELARWYQLYWPRDRELARSFVARAERAGYSAIVVTLDTWLLGWRPADLSEAFLPFLWGEGNRNYLEDPVFQGLLQAPPEEDMQAAIGQWALQFANPSVTWKDLTFLRECTKLPIVLKGIVHPDDARLRPTRRATFSCVRPNSLTSVVQARASSTGFRFSRAMFSISPTSSAARSSYGDTNAGTMSKPAILAARQRRSPATSSYLSSSRGRTSTGCRTPRSLTESASSFSIRSSK